MHVGIRWNFITDLFFIDIWYNSYNTFHLKVWENYYNYYYYDAGSNGQRDVFRGKLKSAVNTLFLL